MPDELTTIAVFQTPLQAAMARNYLESEGITAFLADDETVSMAWHLTGAVGGVKLCVAADQAHKAQTLLDRLEQEREGRELVEDAGDEPDDRFYDDVDEQEPPPSPADELADRAFRAAVLGLLLCPLQLYSMWLLASLFILGEAPSPKMKTRALLAAVLDLWFFVAWYVFFWM
jgi:hypothetical protein